MAVTVNTYNKFWEYVGDGGIDLDGDTFKIELHNNLTFTATHTKRADISATALASGNGYLSPGLSLTSVTWTESSGTLTFDAADAVWSASGGSIGPATDAVIYSDTSTVPDADLLMFNIDFGESKTVVAGKDFTISLNASGLFTVS